MALTTFNNVKFSAQAVVVPEKEINIYDEVQYYDNNVKRVDRMRKMVGFYKRRVSSEKGVCPTDYAIAAAQILFENNAIKKDDVDCLVYVAQRQDYSQPSTCFYVHQKLGLSEKCVPFTVNHGCSAWVYGMYLASSMISSGAHKNVLLLCADTPSVGLDLANRVSAPVFGDGACATLLTYNENTKPIYFNIETFSDGFEAIISPFSGARGRFDIKDLEERKKYLELLDTRIETPDGYKFPVITGYMDGVAVFDFTIRCVPKNIKELMNYSGFSESEVPYLCLHQANKQIVQDVGAEAGFTLEKVPYYAFENYGNNTMCSIPTTLNTVVKENINGETKLICSGFGNGLTVASMAITLSDDVKLFGVFDWKKGDDYVSREEYIEYWKNKIANTKH